MIFNVYVILCVHSALNFLMSFALYYSFKGFGRIYFKYQEPFHEVLSTEEIIDYIETISYLIDCTLQLIITWFVIFIFLIIQMTFFSTDNLVLFVFELIIYFFAMYFMHDVLKYKDKNFKNIIASISKVKTALAAEEE